MRLNSIKLSGFKSFVDPTTLHLNGQLAAVVGPNGCGKSNIIDAVRWVIGESSAKQLRGESMADVIFSGSTARAAVGQASVSLQFDNRDGSLGGAYAAYASIEISRRVNRDGVSTYALNGTNCRRRDILDVFSGTGLGPRSYAVIEQGMINRLIEAKPDELRHFIEEAAGISRYKERRRETEVRLQHTRDNLLRIQDVREELGRQLTHLEKQAAAAERYKLLRQEEQAEQLNLYALQWKTLTAEWEVAQQALQQAELERERLLAEQTAQEVAQLNIQEAYRAAAQAHEHVQAEHYQLSAEIARLEQTLQHQRERLQQCQTDEEGLQRTAQQLSQQQLEDQAACERVHQQLELLAPKNAERTEDFRIASEALQAAEEALRASQSAWDNVQQQLSVHQRTVEVEQTRAQQWQERLSVLQRQMEKAQEEKNRLLSQTNEQQASDLQLQLFEQDTQLVRETEQLAQIQTQVQQQRTHVENSVQQYHEAQNALQDMQSRQHALQLLQEVALGKQSQGFMEWLASEGFGATPRLAERLSVEPGFERAVEVVFGDWLQALYCDQFDALYQAESISTPVSALHTKREQNVRDAHQGSLTALPRLLDKITQPPTVLAAWAQDIYVTETLEQAQHVLAHITQGSVVTADGIWLGQGWIKRLGVSEDPHQGILQRERDLQALTARIVEQESALVLAQTTLETARTEYQRLEKELEACQLRHQEIQRAQMTLSAKHQVQQAEQARQQKSLESLNQLESEQTQTLNTYQESLEKAQRAAQEAGVFLAERRSEQEQMFKAKEEAQQVVRARRRELEELQAEKHQLVLQQEVLKNEQKAREQQYVRTQAQQAEIRERIIQVQQLQETLVEPQQTAEQQLQEALANHARVQETLQQANERLQLATEEQRQSQSQHYQLQSRLQSVQDVLTQQHIQCETHALKRKHCVESAVAITADIDLAVIAAQLSAEIVLAEVEQQLARIQKRIQQLGAINLLAIEEYQNLQERKQYLDAQNADLEEALAMLEEAIGSIDQETRTRFRETFDKINSGFQALFPRVFGGGRASLQMTEADILQAGVMVVAQPPGKRNNSIHILSGGEKALTALALVFSMFQLNPAPFCLLDEVDAPLDDTNVGRFCDLVKEISSRLQVIFITHNKLAMEMADQLIGVSMNEPGVSRLVAVDVQAALETAEA